MSLLGDVSSFMMWTVIFPICLSNCTLPIVVWKPILNRMKPLKFWWSSLVIVCQELQSFCYEEKDFDGLPFDFYGGYIGYIGYVVKFSCTKFTFHFCNSSRHDFQLKHDIMHPVLTVQYIFFGLLLLQFSPQAHLTSLLNSSVIGQTDLCAESYHAIKLY